MRTFVLALLISLTACCAVQLYAAPAQATQRAPIEIAQAEDNKVKPSQLLLQRRKRSADGADEGSSFWDDPKGWIQSKQRKFYGKMAAALKDIRSSSAMYATLLLMGLSFAYGVLHAAGPGHGKAVVSAWLLANERQLRRGVLIAFMAATVQALTAIVLVSVLLLTVKAAARTAKSMAISLEAASYGLIALTGLWLIWQALKPRLAPAAAHAHAHAGTHGHHHDHDHDHHHHLDHHEHGPDCGCGHAHMPSSAELDEPVSWWKAWTIAFAVGIRPCTGGILVLLLSSAIGLYWAGVAATLAMGLGTAITVSVIAIIAVKSRDLALKLAGQNSRWLDWTAFSLKLAGGLFIAGVGALLFWATVTNTQPLI